jgi:YebC/PmpR family DNA-binding regulatory protein
VSGHNKWSQIKYKKAITDAQKGRIFTKFGNAITIAAKEGGPDPETNFKLKTLIEKARQANMPTQNIERAIKRGTGEIEGAKIEEETYEGYGPAGVALLIKSVTDNKNRALNEIRNILSRFGGKLGQPGSVSYLFEQKGIIAVATINNQQPTINKEDIELAAIDAGATDLEEEDDTILIYTKPKELFQVKKQLEEKGIKIESATLSMEPKETIKIEDKQKAEQILKLMDALDECEDVSSVSANFDISDELMASRVNSE